ncbi:hypothetical protein RUND412_006954 [Rhizina undulata]
MIGHVLPLLFAASAVQGIPMAAPQGVTALLAPLEDVPAGCVVTAPGRLGMNIVPVLNVKRQVSQIADGQVQGPAVPGVAGGPSNASNRSAPLPGSGTVSSPGFGFSSGTVNLPGGQFQIVTTVQPIAGSVQQIADGQIQIPGANIPEAPASAGAPIGQPQGSVVQIGDGQVQGPAQIPAGPLAPGAPSNAVSQISDGQIQGPAQISAGAGAPAGAAGASGTPAPGAPSNAVSQISDGQIQGPAQIPAGAAGPLAPGAPSNAVSQISDGQIQGPAVPKGPVQQLPEGQIQGPAVPQSPVQQLPEGQIQGPAVPKGPVQQLPEGQIQGPAVPQGPVQQLPEGQIQGSPAPQGPAVQIPDGQIQGPQKRSILNARQNGPPVELTLEGGVLKDALGRTGYIADNRQLQFDDPPQSGAIYTAGFGACADGTLALGGNNVFYACGSSDFTNLYDQPIFPDNCHAVHIELFEH